MRPSQALPLLVLLLPLASSSASDLEDTCRRFGGADGYNVCIKFFKANRGSATATKRGLAVIATRVASATAVDIRKRIAALKAGVKDQKIQENLATCDKLYYGAVSLLDEAAKGIGSRNLGDAVRSLGAALNVPRGCEYEFRKAGVESPLIIENSECIVTLYVTKLLTAVAS